jgi:hypothetical protein
MRRAGSSTRRRILPWAFVASAISLAGCRATVTTFPHQLRDSAGNPILLDDVEAVVASDATDDEKRQQLRDLGIEDEELIDALLTL